MGEVDNEEPPKGGRWWITLIWCALLVGGSWLLIRWIDFTEPEAQQTQAAKKTAMLVEVLVAEKGDFQPRIEALGEVRAARDVAVGARVSGAIIERSEGFVEGGLVRKGEVLVRLDPTDFEKRLSRRQSEHRQALAELEIEKGQGKIAELDLELLEKSLEVKDKGLALRKPQLQSAEAAVDLAEVAVEEAALELERTEVKAPFDAQVMTQEVEVGAQITSGTVIGRLVGVDQYWVVATLPMSSLRWVGFSGSGEGSEAEIRDPEGWGMDVVRQGKVERLLGSLDEDTRLARVVIVVEDPLGRGNGLPELILGSLLEVGILGDTLAEVVRLPRQYLRKNNTVWINEGGTLSIREVEVAFRDKDYAYLSKGVEQGELIVTTSLATVTEGAALRTKGSGNE